MSHMTSAMDMDKTNKVKLQVGERQFLTTKDTLTGESAYFSALLSGRWNGPDHDGSYFIDSDPELFVEVLRYLRSGNFPLYFDAKTSTFDYAKYAALLGEAQYFQIAKLEDWIQNKRFLKAVTIKHHVEQIEDPYFDETEYIKYCEDGGCPPNGLYSKNKWGTDIPLPDGFQPPIALPDGLKNLSADTHLTISIVPKATKKMRLCPVNIPEHYGRPSLCGHTFLAGGVETDTQYEEEHSVGIVVHTTQHIFDPEVCLGVTYATEKANV
ncbi:hypothetical protein F5Y18DRAFT_199394 [Xylariaceae sp. FL1019]|nr:hypothetical protein F5Y18DRAFT_199394 [Xylariaceae sp. FL1019]